MTTQSFVPRRWQKWDMYIVYSVRTKLPVSAFLRTMHACTKCYVAWVHGWLLRTKSCLHQANTHALSDFQVEVVLAPMGVYLALHGNNWNEITSHVVRHKSWIHSCTVLAYIRQHWDGQCMWHRTTITTVHLQKHSCNAVSDKLLKPKNEYRK